MPDSFTVRICISGLGLKDLVLNHPYIFEICEPEEFVLPQESLQEIRSHYTEATFAPPEPSAPLVCVIDSGIQEAHLFISQAIHSQSSYCYLPNTNCTDVADYVPGGGHGTRVAGAVLFPRGIPSHGSWELPCWIQNARVLDASNGLPIELFPPALIRSITEKYYIDYGTRIFNHSISGNAPSRKERVSAWAAEIDLLSYEYDVIFIQAAGNLYDSNSSPFRMGIVQHLEAGRNFPEYLLYPSCRIANPAQSFQAITVGSISHSTFNDGNRNSFGGPGAPSAMTSTGPGLWNCIKPDVVEYGGTYAFDTGNPPSLSCPEELCPELIRTSPPGPPYASDDIGTSYATPKVAHIVAALQSLLPDEPCLLYRALIAQSARWPEWADSYPKTMMADILRFMGYGLPDFDRATGNTPYRITMITSGRVPIHVRQAHVYQVPIPRQIRAAAEEYDILIEITLSYAAKPRRTRKKIRGYFSTWLDWMTSKKGESSESFSNRILYNGDRSNTDGIGTIPWTIGSESNHGILQGARRNSSSLQKDWAIVKSHELPDSFCIGIKAHPGWDNANLPVFYSLAVSFEAINADIEIYELIETQLRTEIETMV